MGITNLQNWLNKNMGTCVLRQLSKKVNSVSIDGNAIIHECAARVYNYGDTKTDHRNMEIMRIHERQREQQLKSELFKSITDRCYELILKYKPTSTFEFAIDGATPAAKANQTMTRRYRSVQESGPPVQGCSFRSEFISCGTPFMEEFHNYFTNWLDSQRNYIDAANPRPTNRLPKHIIYSSHREFGEGEHKIFENFRRNPDRYEKDDGYHVVHSMDGDLVMIASMANIPKIIVARDNPHGRHGPQYIDIDELKARMVEEYGNPNVFFDVNVIIAMLGNDFLPRSPLVTDEAEFDKIACAVYKDIRQEYSDFSIVDENVNINWRALAYFYTKLSVYDPEMLKTKAQRDLDPRTIYKSDLMEKLRNLNPEIDVNTYRMKWYEREFEPLSLSTPEQYYPCKYPAEFIRCENCYVNHEPAEHEDKEIITYTPEECAARFVPMSLSYMEVLQWILHYYTGRIDPKIYSMRTGAPVPTVDPMAWYPYNFAPFPIDISRTIQEGMVPREYERTVKGIEIMTYIGPQHILAAIMPPSLVDQVGLNKKLYPLIQRNPTKVALISDGCHQSHLLKPIIPPVNFRVLFEEVNKTLGFSGKQYNLKNSWGGRFPNVPPEYREIETYYRYSAHAPNYSDSFEAETSRVVRNPPKPREKREYKPAFPPGPGSEQPAFKHNGYTKPAFNSSSAGAGVGGGHPSSGGGVGGAAAGGKEYPRKIIVNTKTGNVVQNTIRTLPPDATFVPRTKPMPMSKTREDRTGAIPFGAFGSF